MVPNLFPPCPEPPGLDTYVRIATRTNYERDEQFSPYLEN